MKNRNTIVFNSDVTLYEVIKYANGGDITMADLYEVQEYMNGN